MHTVTIKTLAAPGTYNIITLIIRNVMKLTTIKSFKAMHGAYNIRIHAVKQDTKFLFQWTFNANLLDTWGHV